MLMPPGCAHFAHPLNQHPGWLLEEAVVLCGDRLGCAVDAGAHVGTWTVEMARHFQAVNAFEPCAETHALLAENVAHLPHVCVLRLALADRHAELRLALPHAGANSGMRAVATEGERVAAVPLDALNVTSLDLIKLDLEGYEMPALFGARETLRRCRPVVVMEENGAAALHGIPRRAARAFLLGLRYRVVVETPTDLILSPE